MKSLQTDLAALKSAKKRVKIILENSNELRDNTKRFIIHRLKWLGIYMGISLILLYLLPFPSDFISVLGLLVLVNYLRARRSIIKRYGGMDRIKGMFGSVSPSTAELRQHRLLRYYCMSCREEHNDVTCPNCGSKMKRVDI